MSREEVVKLVDDFIKEQINIIEAANDTIINNIKKLHKNQCNNPSPKCEETFIMATLLVIGEELTNNKKIKNDLNRRQN